MRTRSLALFFGAVVAASPAFAQFGGFLNNLANAAKGNNSSSGVNPADTLSAAGQMLHGAAGIGPEEEKVIGDSVALEIVGRYGGLVRDPVILQRVNLVGRSLARYSDRPDLNWRFGVLNSDTVNAFSAPDGYVFITRGLYVLIASDDALAGVLGHEISHITGRHSLKIVSRGTFLSGAANLASATNSTARNVNGQLQQFDVGIVQIANTLFEKCFDPKSEYEADRNGHDLAKVTGYAPADSAASWLSCSSAAAIRKRPFRPTRRSRSGSSASRTTPHPLDPHRASPWREDDDHARFAFAVLGGNSRTNAHDTSAISPVS